ncbi:hypothetical protein AGMMS49992_24970 [Clostridia bacterium]|nr:hypothetical protein AGMMS49992_24970 [Clostridia bacterium]
MYKTAAYETADEAVARSVSNIRKNDTLEQRSRIVDIRFKVVRFGLNFSLTSILLLAFSFVYVKPGEAAFYVIFLTLACDVLLFVWLIWLGGKSKREYAALPLYANLSSQHCDTDHKQ